MTATTAPPSSGGAASDSGVSLTAAAVAGGFRRPAWLEGTLDVISGMAGPRNNHGNNSNNTSTSTATTTTTTTTKEPTPQPVSKQQAPQLIVPPALAAALPMHMPPQRHVVSAPSSPARGHSTHNRHSSSNQQLQNSMPLILRLPSQDSLDVSMHNADNSTKSANQIIKDLRAANARLTARTATLEQDYMNQLAAETRKFEDLKLKYEAAMAQKDKIQFHLESVYKQASTSLKEKDDLISKLKEDSAFQRHTISDLKTQLRQQERLQQQQQESEKQLSSTSSQSPSLLQLVPLTESITDGDSAAEERSVATTHSRSPTSVAMAQGSMLRELQEIKDEKQRLQQELQALRQTMEQTESADSSSISPWNRHYYPHEEQQHTPQRNDQNNSSGGGGGNRNSPSQQTNSPNYDMSGRPIEEEKKDHAAEKDDTAATREALLLKKLDGCQAALAKTANALARLQQEHEYLLSEHEAVVDDLHQQLIDTESEYKALQKKFSEQQQEQRNDKDGRSVVADKNKNNSDVDDSDHLLVVKQFQEELKERDAKIVSLEATVQEKTTAVTQLRAELERVQTAFASQETYRQEEADDLRVLNDAQEEELDRLKGELDEALAELEVCRQELNEVQNQQDKTPKNNNRSRRNISPRTTQAVATASTETCSDSNDDREEEDDIDQVMEESSRVIAQLQQQFQETKTALEQLEGELAETKRENSEHIGELQMTVDTLTNLKEDLECELEDTRQELSRMQEDLNQQMRQQKDELEQETKQQAEQIKVLKSKVAGMQQECDKYESRLRKANQCMTEAMQREKNLTHGFQQEIAKLREQNNKLQKELQQTLKSKDSEISQLKQKLQTTENELSRVSKTSSGEATADSKRVASLISEVTNLKDQLREKTSNAAAARGVSQESNGQSGGSLEEDLRKDLQTSRQVHERLIGQIRELQVEKEVALSELQEKLEDRDTTISSLVKSSVALEQKIAAAKLEIESLKDKLSKGANDNSMDVVLTTSSSVGSFSANQSELDQMRRSLDESKSIEERLQAENARLKKTLQYAKHEISRLRSQLEADKAENRKARNISQQEDEPSNPGDTNSVPSSPVKQLQERDKAIASLVQQSMKQDRVVADLKTKLASVNKELEALRKANKQQQSSDPDTPSKEEIDQLRHETEIFAGQIIELDEEIESLKNTLREREEKIAELSMHLAELKNKPHPTESQSDRIRNLMAEIDELKEANKDQMEELRALRVAAREYKLSAEDVEKVKRASDEAQRLAEECKRRIEQLEFGKANLEKELKEARLQLAENGLKQETIVKLENDIKERDLVIAELKNSQVSEINDSGRIDEMELESLREEKETLKRNLASQSASIEEARTTIRELEKMLAEKSSADSARYDEEREELLAEIESLSEQLEEARGELKKLENERELIDEFKTKLEKADDERAEAEREIIDTYERKLSLLKLDKDVMIDNLRNELTAERTTNAKEMEEMTERLSQCVMEKNDLRDEFEEQIREREEQIFNLQRHMEAQEQLVSNMRSEMDHLQGSMENAAAGRREQIEDMQQELVDLTSTAARQEREIMALRMQLEEKTLTHRAEVARLKDTISSLESQMPSDHRNAADLQMELRIREVKDRLEKLMWRNQVLQEENLTLKQRLEKAERELIARNSGEEQASIVEKRAHELERHLEWQNQRVRDLEEELERLIAKSREPPIVVPELTDDDSVVSDGKNESSTMEVLDVHAHDAAKVKSKGKDAKHTQTRRIGFLGRRKNAADEANMGKK